MLSRGERAVKKLRRLEKREEIGVRNESRPQSARAVAESPQSNGVQPKTSANGGGAIPAKMGTADPFFLYIWAYRGRFAPKFAYAIAALARGFAGGTPALPEGRKPTHTSPPREKGSAVDDSCLISGGWLVPNPLDSRLRGNDGGESGNRGVEIGNGGGESGNRGEEIKNGGKEPHRPQAGSPSHLIPHSSLFSPKIAKMRFSTRFDTAHPAWLY